MLATEKQLLLQDLSARLPYNVKCNITDFGDRTLYGIQKYKNEFYVSVGHDVSGNIIEFGLNRVRPYLRPLSNMTDEERKELRNTMNIVNESFYVESSETFDFYHQHHIDYRGLIDKNLAIDCSNLNLKEI